MTKFDFLMSLHDRLSDLPQDEVEERLSFYIEMIEDRVEEGLSEEEAVSAVGSVDDVAAQIAADIPYEKTTKKQSTPKKHLKAWEIILLVLGSPLWFSLLAAAFAVLLSLYVSLWSVIISLWAVFVSLICCALCGIAAGIGFLFSSHPFTGVAMIGTGVVCAGLSVFLFYGCKWATKGTLALTGKTTVWIKTRFRKKEEA